MRRVVSFVATALAVVLLPAGLAAQGTGTVSGQVTDQANARPIQDVQVSVVGTQRGAITDVQGRYTIVGVPDGARTIRARRVGYAPATQAVTVTSGSTVAANFALTVSVAQLQEVVINAVTGQAQTRVQGGTNAGYVKVDSLNQGAITKMSDVLQGRVAGVNLQGAAGTAGSSQRVRIRGANSLSLSNEPLLYVDGVLVSNSKGGISLGGQDYSRLNDINPEEIDNIEILKGPAASAIYGSAAANGVILISTKRGKAGAPQYRVYAETGTQKDINNYPLNYAALTAFNNTGNYYDIPNGGILNIRSIFGASAPYDICPNYRAAIPVGTTVNGLSNCTQDVLLSFDQFRDARTTPYQNGSLNKAGINVSGGGEAITYFLGADKSRELGVLRPNSVDKVNLRSNLNAKIGQNANAAISMSYISSSTNRISNDNSIFSPLINAFLGPAQYIPGMESDTVSSAGNRLGSYFGYNTADQRKVQADQGVDRFVLGANANYTPLTWLRLNGNAGLDMFNRFDRQTINPNELPLAQSYILGFRRASRAANHLWTTNGSATGTFSLTPDLISTSTFGASYQRGLFETTDCYGVGIPSGTRSCGATTSQFAVDEGYTDERTVGGFARQEFAFADRLFLSGSIRADNVSGLVRNVSGLSYFPSVNASWVVSRESFFPKVNAISQLRLRAGYGQAGQRPGYGAAETFFAPVASQQGGVEKPALVLTSTGNAALKVERTTEIEGGFDVGLLEDRVSAEYTVFTKRSRDALVQRNLPPSAGLTGSVFQNLGSVKNWGQELGLSAKLVDMPNVRFDTRITATVLNNRVEALGQGIAPIVFNRGAQAHREGFPTGAFFARPIRWNDANGDGKLARNEVFVDTSRFLVVPNAKGGLDTLNQAYLGPALPTNTQGFGGDLTLFKRFTISTLFERRAGNKQLNYTEFFRCRTQNANPYYSECSALSNPQASLASQAAFIASQYSEFGATPAGYIEDASFVKWRELTLKVDVPTSITNRIGRLRSAQFSVSGRNLKTWTNYTGLDPEINEGGGSANFSQNEFNTQPPVRTITFRLDVQP